MAQRAISSWHSHPAPSIHAEPSSNLAFFSYWICSPVTRAILLGFAFLGPAAKTRRRLVGGGLPSAWSALRLPDAAGST